MDTATGHNHGPLAFQQHSHSFLDSLRIGKSAFNAPNPLFKEIGRVIVGMRLNVLRQGQRHSAGLDRIGEDPHRFRKSGQELLWPGDSVKEAAHGTETVVDTHVRRNGMFQLL